MVSNKKKGVAKNSPKSKGGLFFAPALEQFLLHLPSRSREIVKARFGISDEGPKTLEEIGQAHHVTRERVRQIVISALGYLAQEEKHPLFVQISERIISALEKKGGVSPVETLLDTLAPSGGRERGALLAFIECLPAIKEIKMNSEHAKVYALKEFSLSEWKKIKDTAKQLLEDANQALEVEELYVRFAETGERMSKQEFIDNLLVANDIRQNVFGKWGLAQWSDIKPRGTREKAFLVLKTTGKPLHFREIAALIDSYGLKSDKKSHSHPQTVHNELIKDDRFVLVGRGTYALSEWGYKKGTVKEVLEDILGKAPAPMTREEVLTQILKIRQVKKSTVIINLNTFFRRVGKNAYSIKK